MKDKITVKKSGLFNKYKTIQKAVDDIFPGGTIYVESGEYIENVAIHAKDVSIIAKGNVILKESQTGAIMSINTCQVTLKGIYFKQDNPSNAFQTMYPVIWVNAQSVVSIKDSEVIGHVSESIYSISSTVEINSCEIKGYGISIKDQSTLKCSKLKINYPFSYGINCVNSELEINEMEATGGGVAFVIDQSKAEIKNLTALHQYRDAVRIIQSEVEITGATIQDFMEIKKTHPENYMSGIDIFKQSKVTLSKVYIKKSQSGAIGVKDSTISISEVEITDVHIGVISTNSKCSYFIHQ